ncbi:DNA-deoxyinosine glycosylase [Pseudoxanthomonas putridarboris]|uniref:DNA-deoxyinosine glycosylase n=1 Tax=Pseudoxanthomonas putridarboris TaxID=752605 RepID=A0ABU9J2C4_9GAMM
MSELLVGLPPRIATDCRVLVLGSMPGGASLRAGEYYAHPRNRFWPLMARLCGFEAALPYEARMHALQQAGVGIWDVIGRCQRAGSLDTAILRGSEVPNPVAEQIRDSRALHAIALNGAKAAEAFRRHVLPRIDPVHRERLAILPMPSTSPANAAASLDRLAQAWSVLGAHLRASPHG